ncbi:MAG: FAD:protein FMN transferase, partial [Gemmatimonadota bacterium]
MTQWSALRGVFVASSLAVVASLAACGRNTPQNGTPTRRTWTVMGTFLTATVWGDDDAAKRALDAAHAAVDRVDSLMSTYRPESEISQVNRRAGTDSVTVLSPETADVLASALRYAARTGGALDVTVGPLVDVWGFHAHAGTVPPPATLDSARALVGWQRVQFDSAARTVRLPRHGMRLDFGAIAKGYALDRAEQAMRRAGARRGMVDLGRNVLVFGPPPHGGQWRAAVVNPLDPQTTIGTLLMDSGAVATSGDYEQFFQAGGQRYGHIFDPRTGMPVQGIASTTVVAPTGIASDALSTALFVLGPDAGCALADT